MEDYNKFIPKKRLKELEKRPFAKLFPEAMENIKNTRCATCGEYIQGFKNEISVKEYRISGMCQKCQDSVFGGK